MKILEENTICENKNSILAFVDEFNSADSIVFYTSGTTASPKKLIFTKKQLQLSAQKTIDFLQINNNSTLLLCLNVAYVAAKMQIIRALQANANLLICNPKVEDILQIKQKINFASYVPLQIHKILESNIGVDFLNKHDAILIGGATINNHLVMQINTLSVPVFQTFGMTETASHFAIRALNGNQKSDFYTLLPNTEIDCDVHNCLKIKSDITNYNWIQTTDIVKIMDKNSFQWLGRHDFVINSGGIKINPETLESRISEIFSTIYPTLSFIISSIPDNTLGEMLVIAIENKSNKTLDLDLLKILYQNLEKYYCPKKIVYLDKFPVNENGKIMRNKIKEMIL